MDFTTLENTIRRLSPDRLFVLTDTNTVTACLPLLRTAPCMAGAEVITIEAGDEHKTIEAVCHVWGELGRLRASRRSLLVALGGGMVTDLGGFAASTFKRGIAFVNVPTTLLAMVDASTGGKTGINFGGLKNEVGVFRDAEAVVICPEFLATLDRPNLLSGYAEMLKHAVISTPRHLADILTFASTLYTLHSTLSPSHSALCTLHSIISESLAVKHRIVEEDPHEHGIRKALNLGHTIGHALESLAMSQGQPVLHGYAVAWGLVGELYLSVVRCGFPADTMRQVVQFVREHYGDCPITCNDYDALVALMTHDKKNHGGEILCTLMGGVGDIRINQPLVREEIFEALDFLREG
ncbi:MAG: 3-dehydroquinate synthase [Bacteroidaceae bacterium]|nr:3-dehydroquinate synthase [Bacteroidaceae bacterium]